MAVNPTYFVAPFAVNGELMGIGEGTTSELSQQGREFWRRLLEASGPAFKGPVPSPGMEHVGLRFTSAEGAALVTFTVRDEIASSAVALRGTNPPAESELLKLFVESVRRAPLAKQSGAGPTAFEAVLQLTQRPLYVVVPWPNPRLSDEELDLVQELDSHLAAALLVSSSE